MKGKKRIIVTLLFLINIIMLIKNSRVTIIRFFPFILSFREFIFLLIPFLFLANVPAILLLIHKLLFHLVFPD